MWKQNHRGKARQPIHVEAPLPENVSRNMGQNGKKKGKYLHLKTSYMDAMQKNPKSITESDIIKPKFAIPAI